MVSPARKRMTAAEFLEWAAGPESRRSELFHGEIVATAPERAEHGRVKARVWRALADAIDRTSLPYEAFVDSLGVAIDDFTVYEPDALVNCGGPVGAEDFALGGRIDLDPPGLSLEMADIFP